MKQIYPNREKAPTFYVPTVDVLKACCWKVCCPLKINIFCDKY